MVEGKRVFVDDAVQERLQLTTRVMQRHDSDRATPAKGDEGATRRGENFRTTCVAKGAGDHGEDRAEGSGALDADPYRARDGRGDVRAPFTSKRQLCPRTLVGGPRRRRAESSRHDAGAGHERIALALLDLDGRIELRQDIRFPGD